MCFDLDSRPPIRPIAGGALESRRRVLVAADGNELGAFEALASQPTGAAILVLPDVRGLHPYYEELALRFAEVGVDALAIDYLGRTAGVGDRGADFDYRTHVNQTRWPGLEADIRAGHEALLGMRSGPRRVFTIGFCFGGRLSFLASTLGLGLAGVIGFYGVLVGEHYNGSAAPVDVAAMVEGPVLGIFGGDDQSITPADIARYDEALTAAGVEHRLVTYPGAPHSFFDRKAADHADASAAAWDEVLRFIGVAAVDQSRPGG
jgi:carboxymethylenebutenolidase